MQYDIFSILNYLLIGTSAIFTIWAISYAIYLILLNDNKEINTRNLGLVLIFLVPAVFFSGIVFVHYFIEKYSFLDFLFDYGKYIALSFWFGFFASFVYVFLERKFLRELKEELKREDENIKKRWELLKEKEREVLKEAEKKAKEIINQAYKDREKIIFEANEEKERLIRQAREEIEQEKKRILGKYREKQEEGKEKPSEKEYKNSIFPKEKSSKNEEEEDIFTF